MSELDIAVVGMAGRWPKAPDLERFWENLRGGVDGLTRFSDEELLAAGVPREIYEREDYVRRRGVVEDPALFDAPFFGFSPREARLVDPQIRLLLECAWEALENGACNPGRFDGSIGVFAGMSQSSYFLSNLYGNVQALGGVEPLEVKLGNDKDFLATLTSYRLDLRGPSINVATACSTSLVAVHLACQALLNRECDAALAGGSTVAFPQVGGYLHQIGGILSADGRTRSFDAGATGSVAGDGVGVVLLRRLEDALGDGDPVRAVIRGSAVNNDGAEKVGFAAPSVEGQAAAISEAHSLAGVEPDSITYVECHGSATPLGDPVEIRALTRAFRAGTERNGYCAVGSVKSNVGHTDAAAGVAGLIKTVLALEHRLIPPSLHFERPNPEIPFEETPFYVARRLADWWPADGATRRAGVSAFGMGGTNAHVVLEEAPERPPSPPPARPWQIVLLSAATPAALDGATDRLALHLRDRPEQPFADVAHTTRVGRRAFRHRRAIVTADRDSAVQALADRSAGLLESGPDSVEGRPVAFLLPGLGDHYPGLAAGLYAAEEVFRATMDRAAEILEPRLGLDIRRALGWLGTPGDARRRSEERAAGDRDAGGTDLARMVGRGVTASSSSPGPLERTAVAHPALFAVEVALARQLAAWGIEPAGLLGYSLGEYTAAHLAGIVSFEDGLALVSERARLIETLPPGAMLAVSLAPGALEAEIDALGETAEAGRLSPVAINGPETTVAAGSPEAVDALAVALDERGVGHRRLPASHAFHSAAMEPVADAFRRILSEVHLAPPRHPFVTAVSGSWVEPGTPLDREHWVRHLLRPVRFADALAALLDAPGLAGAALAEVGPGQGLASLALQQVSPDASPLAAVPLIRPAYDRRPDQEVLLEGLARLWLAGADVDWHGFAAGEVRRKVALPTYPFQRELHWVERPRRRTETLEAPADSGTTSRETDSGPEADPGIARSDTAELVPPMRGLHGRPSQVRTPFVAPRDATEEAVAAVWRELLELSEVGVHDSLFELGGTSLLAPRLLGRIERRLGVAVPLPRLLAAPTVAELARAVAEARAHGDGAGTPETGPAPGGPDDVHLDPSIVPASPVVRGAGATAPATMLLTGGSGFLGAHLLGDLLRAGHRVVCLVRAGDVEEGRRRLEANLEQHRIELSPGAREGIEPFPGDLAAPRWGLEENAFERLADRLDGVVHAGAWVNFTYPYAVLEPVNVGGTREALRLASTGRAKPFHFVSSISVVGASAPGEPVPEEPCPGHPDRLIGGYPQSKWAGERLVMEAMERGLPATVFRPGVIAGAADTGIGNPKDLIWAFVKGCLQLGLAPDLQGGFDPVPVDFVSRVIVAVAGRPADHDKVFHLVHPEPLPWAVVFDRARALGYTVRRVPVRRWWRALDELLARPEGESNALAPFRPLLDTLAPDPGSGALDEGGTSSPRIESDGAGRPREPEPGSDRRFDWTNAESALAAAGLTWPAVDGELLDLYLESLIVSGFLPPPERSTKGIPAEPGEGRRSGARRE